MPTPFEIDQQIALEREQIRQGLDHLHSNTRNLEEKSYASSSVYGVASIRDLIPHVVCRINATRLRIKQGSAGVSFKDIHQYLEDLQPEAAAAIACKLTFDKVLALNPKPTLFLTSQRLSAKR